MAMEAMTTARVLYRTSILIVGIGWLGLVVGGKEREIDGLGITRTMNEGY